MYQGCVQTLNKLKENRKAKERADPSFDLDGDGAVGARDFYVASKFDKNKDGRLDSKERAACIEALRNGYEKQQSFVGPRTGDADFAKEYQASQAFFNTRIL